MSRSTSAGLGGRALAGLAGVSVVAAVAAVSVVAPGQAVITAADPTVTPIVVPDATERAPLLSDDGAVVLFTSTVDPGAIDPPPAEAIEVLRVHDRVSGTTADVAVAAEHAALSGDGCVIAYTVAPTPEPGDVAEVAELGESDIAVVDRCAAAPADPVIVARSEVVAPLALDRLGGTLVANSGAEIIRFVRSAGAGIATFAEAQRFDASPQATDETVTIGRVDVSADGGTVAFEAGPAPIAAEVAANQGDADPTPGEENSAEGVEAAELVEPDAGADPDLESAPQTEPQPPAAYVWSAGSVTSVAADAGDVSISADGRLVAVVSRSSLDPTQAGVQVIDRGDGTGEPVATPLLAAATTPVISPDGRAVYATTAAGLQRVVWTGAGEAPFDAIATTDLGAPVEGGARLPVPVSPIGVSSSADVIVFDGIGALDLLVRAEVPAIAFGQATYPLGTGEVGETLTTEVVISNDGAVSVDLANAAITVGSPFVLTAAGAAGSTPCTAVLRPGATCSLTVSYGVAVAIDLTADLTVTLEGDTVAAASATVTARGATPTTVTTAPPATNPATTVTTTRPTTQNTTVTTSRPSTGGSNRPTTQNTVFRPTTPITTTATGSPALTPSTFEFAPTIVDAGRRTAAVAVVNGASLSATVSAVRIDSADGAIALDPATTCVGAVVAAGANCRIDLVFAPTQVGPSTASLVVAFADGSEARASLSGVGAPPPTLSVVPGVANHGQVVTVRGGGFPAGSTVQVSVGSEPEVREAIVGDVGTFDLPIVVLPHTMPGPLTITVLAQPDVFAAVEASLLVATTSDRTSPAVLRGAGPSIGR